MSTDNNNVAEPLVQEAKMEVVETKEKEVKVQSLDTVDDTPMKFVTKDKKEFTLSKTKAQIATVFKTAIETDPTATEIPVPSVTGSVFELFCKYAEHHNGKELEIIEKPLRSKNMKDVAKDPWDAEFIDNIGKDKQLLYDVILAANYIDCKTLLHLGCAKVASMIKGQPLEKIKEILDPAAKVEEKKEEKKEEAKVEK